MFDLTGVDSNTKFEGKFKAQSSSVEQKSDKNGNPYLIVQFEIKEGTFDGWKLKKYFFMGNEIDKAVMAKFLDVTGLPRQFELKDLQGRIVMVDVKMDKEGRSNIKGFEKFEAPAQDI